MINLNDVAQKVAELEGKKKETDIAQIKEVMARMLDVLAEFPADEVIDLLMERRVDQTGSFADRERVLQLFSLLQEFIYGQGFSRGKERFLKNKILDLSDLRISELWELVNAALMRIARKHVRK